jgi:hypothetical protein
MQGKARWHTRAKLRDLLEVVLFVHSEGRHRAADGEAAVRVVRDGKAADLLERQRPHAAAHALDRAVEALVIVVVLKHGCRGLLSLLDRRLAGCRLDTRRGGGGSGRLVSCRSRDLIHLDVCTCMERIQDTVMQPQVQTSDVVASNESIIDRNTQSNTSSERKRRH